MKNELARLYVYALVPSGLDVALGVGLVDEPLRTESLGRVGAVVGEMEDRPSMAPATLEEHDEVVRRIARASDAILPLPFGAMVESVQELQEGLAPRLEALASALERTRGCDQMTLRLDESAEMPALARVREAMRPFVRAETIETRAEPPLRTTLFHLVERAGIGEYRARLDGLAAAIAPARLTVTGPWPPYAFTELQ